MSIPVNTVASTSSMSLSSNVIATLQPIHAVLIKENMVDYYFLSSQYLNLPILFDSQN
jgi:hypothetical protein